MTRFDDFGHIHFRTKLYLAFSFLVSFSAKITDENLKIINLCSGSVSVQSGQTYNHNRRLCRSLIGHNATSDLVSISLLQMMAVFRFYLGFGPKTKSHFQRHFCLRPKT